MSQNFHFSFSGDDIDGDVDGAEFDLPGEKTSEMTSSTAQHIEPRLHTLEELVCGLYLLVFEDVLSAFISNVLAFQTSSLCLRAVHLKEERL